MKRHKCSASTPEVPAKVMYSKKNLYSAAEGVYKNDSYRGIRCVVISSSASATVLCIGGSMIEPADKTGSEGWYLTNEKFYCECK